MMLERLTLVGLLAWGCLIPPPTQRASDAARDLNIAARFGRLDLALELTSAGLRPEFLKSRSQWGRSIRVMDVEMAEFSMPERDRAQVRVDYSWSRVDEGVLRTTRVEQEWRDSGGGFRLVRERHVAGDLGLLGEPMPAPEPTDERRDVQFATKVIR